jgi:hypothetical protein
MSGSARTPDVVRESLHTAAAGLVAAAFGLALYLANDRVFWNGDMQLQVVPISRDIARSLGEGHLPLISPYSWNAGALAGEMQWGVFSPVELYIDWVTWHIVATGKAAGAALVVAHLAILASGSFRYGRSAGLDAPGSYLVAIAVALNGFLLSWAAPDWLAALTSFAFVPWALWALERAQRSPVLDASTPLAAAFLALIVLAGWPYSLLMVGLASAWLAARALVERRTLRAIAPLVLAWGLGVGLAAPMLLVGFEYAAFCARTVGPGGSRMSMLPLEAVLGAFMPSFPAVWWGVGGPSVRSSPELADGLAPAVGLVCAVALHGRSFLRAHRWEASLLATGLLLAASPSLMSLRWSFRWVPLVHLMLARLGAHGLSLVRQEAAARPLAPLRRLLTNPGLLAAAVLLVLGLRALELDVAVQDGAFELGRDLFVLSLLWAAGEARLPAASALRSWVPVGVALVALWMTYDRLPPGRLNPRWTFQDAPDSPGALDRDVRYFSVYTSDDIYAEARAWNLRGYQPYGRGAELWPADRSLYPGVEMISGYSTMLPGNLHEAFTFDAYGYLVESRGHELLRADTARGGLLDSMGVDGLLVSKRFAADVPDVVANGWRVVNATEGSVILRREGAPSARVRAAEGSGLGTVRIGQVTSSRLRVDAEVETAADRPGLLIVARAFYPGWRARVNGQEVPVEQASLVMPAVRIPAGTRGTVTLWYEPRSLVRGLWIAAFAAAGLLATVWRVRPRARGSTR